MNMKAKPGLKTDSTKTNKKDRNFRKGKDSQQEHCICYTQGREVAEKNKST